MKTSRKKSGSPKTPRGPKPEMLKIEGNWKAAVKKSLAKKNLRPDGRNKSDADALMVETENNLFHDLLPLLLCQQSDLLFKIGFSNRLQISEHNPTVLT